MGYCDTCHNMGVIECLCGGDMCVCGRGEIECPNCDGGCIDDDEDYYEVACWPADDEED